MRELTISTNDIKHPHALPDGSVVWVDASIRDRLQNGCPITGWEGDPRLEVYLGPENRLHLWRLEADGEYRLLARSAPNAPLDERIIHLLVAHDTRRGYKPKESVDAHNAQVRRARDEKDDEKMSEAADRLAHGVRKDIGYHYGGLSKVIL